MFCVRRQAHSLAAAGPHEKRARTQASSGPHLHPIPGGWVLISAREWLLFPPGLFFPLVSQVQEVTQGLLEPGPMHVYFAVITWGSMGCLRLFLAIDLHLRLYASEWTCGEDFGITLGCPRLPRNGGASLGTLSPPGVKGGSRPLRPNNSCGEGGALCLPGPEC